MDISALDCQAQDVDVFVEALIFVLSTEGPDDPGTEGDLEHLERLFLGPIRKEARNIINRSVSSSESAKSQNRLKKAIKALLGKK